jgi:hypothetical protein
LDCNPGGNSGAGALVGWGPAGQCETTFFNWPNSSFAWAQATDFVAHPGYCYIIQNDPNVAQYDEPEVVYSNTNKVSYQVPTISIPPYCL